MDLGGFGLVSSPQLLRMSYSLSVQTPPSASDNIPELEQRRAINKMFHASLAPL